MSRGAAPSVSFTLFCAGVLAIAMYATPDLAAWYRSKLPAPVVQTSARIQCQRPSEFETLLVFVNADANGVLRISCGHVGGEGAYVKESRR